MSKKLCLPQGLIDTLNRKLDHFTHFYLWADSPEQKRRRVATVALGMKNPDPNTNKPDRGIFRVAAAFCSPRDQFSRHVGVPLAYRMLSNKLDHSLGFIVSKEHFLPRRDPFFFPVDLMDMCGFAPQRRLHWWVDPAERQVRRFLELTMGHLIEAAKLESGAEG